MKEQIKSHEAKMQKTLDVLSKELAAVRAGRANPAVLDKITVEYYGAPTPLNQVAAISTPDRARWPSSRGTLGAQGHREGDSGLRPRYQPQNDGKQIRLNFPPLTEERRKELIKAFPRPVRRQRLRSATSAAMHWTSSRQRRRRARSPRTSCTTARTRCRS